MTDDEKHALEHKIGFLLTRELVDDHDWVYEQIEKEEKDREASCEPLDPSTPMEVTPGAPSSWGVTLVR